MRRLLLTLILFFVYNLSFSQGIPANNFTLQTIFIPSSHTVSTASVAEYIRLHFKTDIEKAGAIYSWVTSNIRYDTDSINAINLGLDPTAKVSEAFRRRKGVCENYAAIFNDISRQAGLQCFVIDGYTKQSGIVDKVGHNWCALFINEKWYLSDPTWGSTSGLKSKYFLALPTEFIETHMPFDPMWQCLNYTVSTRQFYSGNTYPIKNQPYFNYADSIQAYLKLDSLQQLSASAGRLRKSGLENELTRDRLNYLKMHMEMINQDKDVNLYSAAVARLNDATIVYNNFVLYRNNRFNPVKEDSVMQALLGDTDAKLESALQGVDEIERSQATFTFSTEALRTKLISLRTRISEQKDFLRRYLSTNAAERNSLFYK